MKIYKIINKINGKVYVGCTTKSIEERFSSHYKRRLSNKNIFSKALRKYLKSDFKIEEIERCSSLEEMLLREIYWISFYKSTDIRYGYNMIEGGNKPPVFYGESHPLYGKGMSDKQKEILRLANVGRKQSREHIEKCRLTRIGKKATLEHIEKCRIAKAGFKHSEESKNKISKSKKDKPWSAEGKERFLQKMTGRKLSPEHIEKVRLTHLGKNLSEKVKQKIRIANLGKKRTDETKNNMSVVRNKFIKSHPFYQGENIICLTNNKVYMSHQHAAQMLGIKRPGITNVVNGKATHTGGYKFQRLTDEHLIF